MPPKQTSEARKANLLKAREILESPAAPSESDLAIDLAISQKNLASAKTQVTSLEHAVENLEATCAQLSRDLDVAKLKITDLNLALQAERERSENLYTRLRVEHCAWQHSDKRK